MRKFIKSTVIIGLSYLIIIFIISIKIGLPPFNKGYVIGFPTMYYSFEISPNENQHGFMGLISVSINLVIILFISFIYTIFKNNRRQ